MFLVVYINTARLAVCCCSLFLINVDGTVHKSYKKQRTVKSYKSQRQENGKTHQTHVTKKRRRLKKPGHFGAMKEKVKAVRVHE